jgi:hypothetical protein
VALPVRSFPAPEAAIRRAEEARHALERLRRAHPDDAAAVHQANVRAKHTAMLAAHARLAGGRSEVPIELQAIRVGDAALLSAPLEVFAELGDAVARESPFAWTAVSGYSNGSAGYLPTREAADEGGYEVETASPFTRDAGQRFVAAGGRLLRQLHDRRPRRVERPE